jgi:putative membrane protein
MKRNTSSALLKGRPTVVREGDRDVPRQTKHGWPLRRISGRMLGMLSGLSMPAIAWAQERPYDFWWGMHPMWGMWGAWGIGMMFMMLVFWGLLIVGLVLGMRWLISQGRESRSTPRSDTALDILRQRYARGEIDKEEFEAKKRDLS